jgi:hypothetical protein
MRFSSAERISLSHSRRAISSCEYRSRRSSRTRWAKTRCCSRSCLRCRESCQNAAMPAAVAATTPNQVGTSPHAITSGDHSDAAPCRHPVGPSAWELDCHASLTGALQVRRHPRLSVDIRQGPPLTLPSGTQRARANAGNGPFTVRSGPVLRRCGPDLLPGAPAWPGRPASRDGPAHRAGPTLAAGPARPDNRRPCPARLAGHPG